MLFFSFFQIFRTSIEGEEDVTIVLDKNKLKKRVFYEKQEEYRNLVEQRIWSTRRRYTFNLNVNVCIETPKRSPKLDSKKESKT